MLKIAVIVIGIIAVIEFICSVCNSWNIDKLKREVGLLDIQAVKKFDPYAKDWDLTAHDLRFLKKKRYVNRE